MAFDFENDVGTSVLGALGLKNGRIALMRDAQGRLSIMAGDYDDMIAVDADESEVLAVATMLMAALGED